jgi:acetylornithine deacetylase/succinyl-diaminopimelate desuccinylase-like protein
VASCGGSLLHNLLVIAFPIANHDDNQHASNENLRLQNLWDGLEVFAAFFTGLDASKN